jgi:hypothetical protein
MSTFVSYEARSCKYKDGYRLTLLKMARQNSTESSEGSEHLCQLSTSFQKSVAVPRNQLRTLVRLPDPSSVASSDIGSA